MEVEINTQLLMTSQPAFTCSKLTYFTPCSSVSIVNFEQVNASWVSYAKLSQYDHCKSLGINLARPMKVSAFSDFHCKQI